MPLSDIYTYISGTFRTVVCSKPGLVEPVKAFPVFESHNSGIRGVGTARRVTV